MINIKKANKEALRAQLRFLQLLEEEYRGDVIAIPFEELYKLIGVNSRNTLKNYLHEFEAAGILKFRYKGEQIYLNPDIFGQGLALPLDVQAFVKASYDNVISD